MKTLSELGISPAPWGTYQTKKEVAVTTSEKGFSDLVSTLCRGPCRKPNAHLIAAAPKLYGALHDVIAYCEENHLVPSDKFRHVLASAHAALVAAAGESEEKR